MSESAESGRGRGGTPGRGGRGRFGGRGTPPSAGRGAAGRGSSPSGGARGRGASPFSGGRGRSSTPYATGRGWDGRRAPTLAPQQQQGSPSPSQQPASSRSAGRGVYLGGSPALNAGVGIGGGKLFGRGPEAVAYEKDKERGLWKVGPPAGQRFSAAWLRGLSAFVAWKQAQQAQQPRRQERRQLATPATPPPPPAPVPAPQEHAEGRPAGKLVGPGCEGQQAEQHLQQTPGRPPVTGERLPSPSHSELARQLTALNEGRKEAEAAEQCEESLRAGDAASIEAATEAAIASAASQPGQGGGMSPTTSCSSDQGWAAALGARGAASPGSSSSTSAADSCSMSPAGDVPGLQPPEASCHDESLVPASQDCRHWWPASGASLQSAEPVAVEPSVGAGPAPASLAPIELSLRLERMALTDREAHMLADWCCKEAAGAAAIRKLWLFDNRLGDEGAAAVARILAAHPGMTEVHLSHNLLTLRGAAVLLQALPVADSAGGSAVIEAEQDAEGLATPTRLHQPEAEAEAALEGGTAAVFHGSGQAVAATRSAISAVCCSRPLWLRLEWNRISLEGLVKVLEEQNAARGLVVDLPTAVRADAAPSMPDLPPYLAAAAAAAPAGRASVPASRGSRNALQFLVEDCHARLPWISCQYQLPSEAAVLKTARRGWSLAAPPPPPLQNSDVAATPVASTNSWAAADLPASSASPPASSGPLLLFPDTSALLPMLGAGPSVAVPTWLTLDLLGHLAQQGRFGRALPPHEQVFLVVTDSVLKQLDGLKNDPAARPAVRRFLGQGLDAYGPAGADFLTVLGAHEGEGLVVEHDVAVAGSRSADVATKGQRADHRIVEVALFFQLEVLTAAAAANVDSSAGNGDSSSGSGGEGGGASSGRSSRCLTAGSFPVLLLSGDNAQVQTARSHGLPAVRMADVAAAQGTLEAVLEQQQQPLTASLLRACLGSAAVTGLADSASWRSLQSEFDDAIAALEAATDALAASQRQLDSVAAAIEEGQAGGEADAGAVLQAVQQALHSAHPKPSPQQLLTALRSRLPEWQQLVRSHQDTSRLHRWATSGGAQSAGASAVST